MKIFVPISWFFKLIVEVGLRLPPHHRFKRSEEFITPRYVRKLWNRIGDMSGEYRLDIPWPYQYANLLYDDHNFTIYCTIMRKKWRSNWWCRGQRTQQWFQGKCPLHPVHHPIPLHLYTSHSHTPGNCWEKRARRSQGHIGNSQPKISQSTPPKNSCAPPNENWN